MEPPRKKPLLVFVLPKWKPIEDGGYPKDRFFLILKKTGNVGKARVSKDLRYSELLKGGHLWQLDSELRTIHIDEISHWTEMSVDTDVYKQSAKFHQYCLDNGIDYDL